MLQTHPDPPLSRPKDATPLWPGNLLAMILAVTAIFAVAVPALLVIYAPPTLKVKARISQPKRIVPKTVLPTVEPVKLAQLTPKDAVAINDAVPFSKAPNPAAQPFRFTGSAIDRERAVACLAAAMLYEAGDDPTGERAVGQVVLNRVRHPAFPSSVCGVVFQGSERRTGCQFTFTCDGALARHYSQSMWDRAKKLAADALDGTVDKTVGYATHYHTNWVVPYWSASLDKIAAVETHLFFRWTGWWGTPPAFSRKPSGTEPIIPQLAIYSPAHSASAQDRQDAIGTMSADALPDKDLPTPIAVDKDTFVTPLDPRLSPSDYEVLARRVCGDRSYCKFLGWDDPKQVPHVALSNLPADSPALQTMAFSFLRDRSRQFEKALWNCDVHPRDNKAQCMKRLPILVKPAEAAVRLQDKGASNAKSPVDAATSKRDSATIYAAPRAVVQPLKPVPHPTLTPGAAPN